MQGANLGQRRTPEQREALKGRNHYRNPLTITCQQCGQTVELPGKRRRPHIRFCGTECWYDYVRLHPEASGSFKGGREPYYGPNWPQQAKLARERDNHSCQRCGKHQRRPLLDVHHIRPRRAFKGDYEAANALDNLVTLCKSCHIAIERRHAA